MRGALVAVCVAGLAALLGCRDRKLTPPGPDGGQGAPVIAIDKSNMDLTVAPGEDFYRYVNGNWLRKNPIPPGHNVWGTFAVLRQQNAKVLRGIMEATLLDRTAAPGSAAQLLRDFYTAAMDTAAIERAGQTPLDPYFRMIDSIRTLGDLAAVVGELHRSAAPQAMFLFYRDVDADDPRTPLAALKQGGFALPGRSYYLDQTTEAIALRDMYRQHVQRMFRLLGQSDAAAANADIVLRLETMFAKSSLTPEQEREPKLTFHRMKLADLRQRFPRFAWDRYFAALALPAAVDINVVTPEFFAAQSAMIARVPLEKWRVYLTWNTLTTNAPLLSRKFVDEHFDFFERTLTGVMEPAPRWQRVLAQTESGLGWALAQEYVKRHFSPRAKERMLLMVRDIRETFQRRILDLDWVSEETKRNALAKLEGIVVAVGYPDRWPDLPSVAISPSAYLANVVRLNRYQVAEDISKLSRAVDRSEFGMTPQQVNAYYSPPDNKIVLPAGILQPPFFHESFDDAVNYGAIGCVIAHEFTHAFDDQGSQYDAEGRLRNWWTDDDLRRFKIKQKLVSDQYNGYTVLDSLRMNGALTVGENIADLGGVTVAFQAFQTRQSMAGRGKDIDGFTPEQRFFIAWAQLWRVNMTPEAMRRQVKGSTTSYYPFRVIGPLSNLDSFISAFGLKEGEKMVRKPGRRVRIW
jgi:putative endopeptidase